LNEYGQSGIPMALGDGMDHLDPRLLARARPH
jgi:hypothetical protein